MVWFWSHGVIGSFSEWCGYCEWSSIQGIDKRLFKKEIISYGPPARLATCHTSDETLNLLSERCDNRIVSESCT